MGKRRVALASMCALLMMGPAVEATERELLDVLLENGTITREQYDRLLRPREEPEEPAAEKTGDGESAATDGISVALDGDGLGIETSDGAFAMQIGGRLHVDASGHRDDLPDAVEAIDGTELRRARLELAGRMFADWFWQASVDFADDDVAVKDFFLGYSGIPGSRVSIGHQKQPYGLALEMSSNDLPFVERSVDTFLLTPFVDRAIGVRGEVAGEHWFVASGVFGEAVDPNSEDDEGWGAAGRAIFSPVVDEDRVFHFGVRAAYRKPGTGGKAIRIRDETTHMSNLSIVDTGVMIDVDRTVLVGGEAAFAVGPVWGFGEYTRAFLDRGGSADVRYDGWHLGAAWTLTGESRASVYKMSAGEFKGLDPDRDFSLRGGGWGAWELAARIAYIDLNDGAVRGGRETVATTGLNWYANSAIRLMFDWSRIVDTDDSTELRNRAEDMDIFQFRAQLVF